MSAAPRLALRHGVDLVDVERLRRALDRTPGFEDRVFTESERAYCRSQADPAIHFAARFAAKEAGLKALGLGLSAIGVVRALQDLEVVRVGTAPRLALRGKPRAVADRLGVVDVALSLATQRPRDRFRRHARHGRGEPPEGPEENV